MMKQPNMIIRSSDESAHSTTTGNRRTDRIRRKRTALLAILSTTTMGLSLIATTGCSVMNGLSSKLSNSDCIDEFMITHRNKVMATKAWLRIKSCYKNHCNINDLRAGFIDGYLEVATGGSGCTPTVVSPKYWGWRHQSGNGQSAINAWFEGFPLGVKAAEQDGVAHYNQIRIMAAPQPVLGMNGSLAPTPAAPPAVAPLPPGIVLGEGESLVPGGVRYESLGGSDEAETTVAGNRDAEADDAKSTVGDTLDIDAADERSPLETASPFENDLGAAPVNTMPATSPQELVPANSIQPLLVDDVSAEPSVGTSARLGDTDAFRAAMQADQTALKNVPAGDSQEQPEPSQAEIDSVIEEIFGKAAGNPQSGETNASKASPSEETIRFLFD